MKIKQQEIIRYLILVLILIGNPPNNLYNPSEIDLKSNKTHVPRSGARTMYKTHVPWGGLRKMLNSIMKEYQNQGSKFCLFFPYMG